MSFGHTLELDPAERPAPPAGVLSLAAGPAAANDTTERRIEMKFAVPTADTRQIRAILAAVCRRIVHDQPVSQVNSIYFDDCFPNNMPRDLASADRRTQVRLRWYGNGEPGRRVFFEVKRRFNHMIGKDRLAIESAQPVGELSYDELRDELGTILPAPLRSALLLRPDAVVINSCSCEYFAFENTPLCITLATEIVCYDQAGLLRPRLRFGVPLRGLAVIQAKAPCGHEDALRRVIHPLRLQLTRCTAPLPEPV